MEKFKNKYRILSARAHHWDYRWAAAYFITICTKNRRHFFGKMVNGKMQLSQIGQIVHSEWLKTFELRPDMNLSMGEFVVMPDHFHAIIGIGVNEYNSQRKLTDCAADGAADGAADNTACGTADGAANDTACGTTCGRDAMHCVSTDTVTTQPQNQFGPQSKNLASIIRGFKIGVTKNARLICPEFEWQSRFHDHIIRDDQSFQNISNYIINNPANWKENKFRNKRLK